MHPVRQHSYQVALALQHAGLLREFITGLYYKPGAFPFALLRGAPRSLQERIVRQLEKRNQPGLRDDLVRSWPYAEIIWRTIGRIGWLDRLSGDRLGDAAATRATDRYTSRRIGRMRPRPRAVYAFLGAARRTFARARELGIQTILDVPSVLDAHETFRREYRLLGLDESLLPPAVDVAEELRAADWMVAPSAAVAESVRRAGLSRRPIAVVPFGADTSIFRPAVRTASGRRFRAVFAGRLEARKGLHYLVEAWRQAGLDGELVLAGPPSGAEYMARLRQQYDASIVETGNLAKAELAALLSTADVFVFPSLSEGSAIAVYEALASGVPCVVTSESGSVVRDGIDGFVIGARDVKALEDRLERLHRDVELRRRMAAAAVERGTEFTWERYRRDLASVVAQALGYGGTPPAVPQDT